MGKKYVPSGYQIINIVFNSPNIVDSEDKKLLIDILKNESEKDAVEREIKPILLRIYDSGNDYTIIGFATYDGNGIGVSVHILDEQTITTRSYYISLNNNMDDLICRMTEIE